jgi:hypothetical protein
VKREEGREEGRVRSEEGREEGREERRVRSEE